MEYPEFKFQLGETVAHKAMINQKENGKPLRHTPQRFFITERILQECVGGVQKHYRVRAISFSEFPHQVQFSTKVMELHEEELVELPKDST